MYLSSVICLIDEGVSVELFNKGLTRFQDFVPDSSERLRLIKQTDRHTDGLSKTTFLAVLGVVHPKSGLMSKSIFCTMPILPLTWK